MAALPDPKTVNPDETFAKPPWDAPNTPYTNRPPLSQTLQSYYGALKGGGGAYRHVLTTHVAQGEAWSKIVGTRVKDTVIPRTGEPLIKDCRALFDYRSLELMFMHSDHRSLDYLLRYVMMKSAFGPPHPPVLVELLPRALTARPTLVGLCAIKTAEALQEIGKGGVLKLAEPPSSGSLVNQALAPLSILLDFPEWGALVVESPEKVFYMWDQAIELALKKRLSPPPSAEGKGQGGGEASIWDKILAVLVCRRAYLTHLLQEKSGKGYEEIEKVTNPIVNRIPDEITQEKVRYQARYPKSSGDLFAMVGLRISFKKPVIKFEDLIFAAIGNNLGPAAKTAGETSPQGLVVTSSLASLELTSIISEIFYLFGGCSEFVKALQTSHQTWKSHNVIDEDDRPPGVAVLDKIIEILTLVSNLHRQPGTLVLDDLIVLHMLHVMDIAVTRQHSAGNYHLREFWDALVKSVPDIDVLPSEGVMTDLFGVVLSYDTLCTGVDLSDNYKLSTSEQNKNLITAYEKGKHPGQRGIYYFSFGIQGVWRMISSGQLDAQHVNTGDRDRCKVENCPNLHRPLIVWDHAMLAPRYLILGLYHPLFHLDKDRVPLEITLALTRKLAPWDELGTWDRVRYTLRTVYYGSTTKNAVFAHFTDSGGQGGGKGSKTAVLVSNKGIVNYEADEVSSVLDSNLRVYEIDRPDTQLVGGVPVELVRKMKFGEALAEMPLV